MLRRTQGYFVLLTLNHSTNIIPRNLCHFSSVFSSSKNATDQMPYTLSISNSIAQTQTRHRTLCHKPIQQTLNKVFTRSLTELSLKHKGPQCSGCGAEFQTESQEIPGYLPKEIWKQINKTTLAEEAFDGKLSKDFDPETLPCKNKKKQEEKEIDSESKELTEDQIQEMIKNIDDQEVKSLFILNDSIGAFAEPQPKIGDGDVDGSVSKTKAQVQAQTTAATAKPKNGQELVKRIVCQRCFNIKHYNRLDTHWKKNIVNDPKALQFLKYNFNSLAIVVVDLFDLPNSFIPNLSQFIGEHHRIILVANKVDLLPKDVNLVRLEKWLFKEARAMNINIRGIFFISAKKNLGVRELAAKIQECRKPTQDIFFLGRANVGKSELINALLRISYKTYNKYKLVASNIPGTTISVFGIPLKGFIKSLIPMDESTSLEDQSRKGFVYDTPGVYSSRSIINVLKNDELAKVLPVKKIVPLTYEVSPGDSIMLGACGRLDFVSVSNSDHRSSDKLRVTVFSNLKVHVTSIRKADTLYANLSKGINTILLPLKLDDSERAFEFPKFRKVLDFKVEGIHPSKAWLDVVFSGIGWFALTGNAQEYSLQVFSPNGLCVSTREPMLPFEYRHWLKKRGSNLRKT